MHFTIYQPEHSIRSNTQTLSLQWFTSSPKEPKQFLYTEYFAADFLGCLNMVLTSLPEEQSGRRAYDGNMVLAGLEEAFAGELHITVEQGWETKM